MEQEYVTSSIAEDIRIDGRRRTELRDFTVRQSVNPQARGSSQVRLGESCVMCYIYSDVTDRDPDAARDGISFGAKIISKSDDVSQSAVNTLQTDLAQLFGRTTAQSPAGKDAVSSVVSKLFSGGAQRKNGPMDRCGVGIKLVAELSILCGAGGNLVGASALAIKSALWGSSLPRVHITASGGAGAADGAAGATAAVEGEEEEVAVEASAVEVDEKQRESISAIAVAMPIVVKSVSTAQGYYCVDSLREEEAAAAFDCVVAVQTASATSASTDADSGSSGAAAASSSSSSSSTSNIVYSRFHSSKTTSELSVVDITTILTESAALAEQLGELWSTKIQ